MEKLHSTWDSNNCDDLIHLVKRNNSYYGYGRKFDFERNTLKEATNDLKKWNYRKIS